MNICLLCRNFYKDVGGIETFTLNFSKALVNAGHTVHVLTEDKGDFNRQEFGAQLLIHHVVFNDHPFPGAWTIEKVVPLEEWRYSRAVAQAIDAVNEQSPLDVIETFDYFRQGFAYTKRRDRIPVFLRLHGWFFNRTDGRVDPWPTLSFKERISWRMHRNTLLRADGVAAVAADTADFAKKIWKITREIKIIYNAVDANRFSPEGEKDPSQVLFSGRLIPRKGIDALSQAMPLVIKECPNVKLAVAGTDALNEAGRKNSEVLREQIGSKHFQYLGQLPEDDLRSWLRKSSILIMPSLDEAFPLSALEAMASGCALVASTAGGLKELVRHEDDGLLIKPGDASMLAKAIIRLLKDPGLCQKLATKGMEKVRTDYSYEKLVKNSIDSYRDAIRSYNKTVKL